MSDEADKPVTEPDQAAADIAEPAGVPDAAGGGDAPAATGPAGDADGQDAAATVEDQNVPAAATAPPVVGAADDGPVASPPDAPASGPGDPAHLRGALEAVLLVVDTPVTTANLAAVLDLPVPVVEERLVELRDEYDRQGRGFALREIAGGWRLYTREEFAPYVERFVLDGQQTRLTQAALETLAVVAYCQPVTRSRVAAIRGVGVDGVMRTLLNRNLIEECGTDPQTGGHLYRTTPLFLEKLGLRSLEELPPLAPLLPEIDAVDDVASSA